MKRFLFTFTLLSFLNIGHARTGNEINVVLSDVAPFAYLEGNTFKGYNVDVLRDLEKLSRIKFNYYMFPHVRIVNQQDKALMDLFIIHQKSCNDLGADFEIQQKLYMLAPAILVLKTVDTEKPMRIGKLRGTCTTLGNKYLRAEDIVELNSFNQAVDMIKHKRLEGVCGLTPVIHHFLPYDLVTYKTQSPTPDTLLVICRRKNLPKIIKEKLKQAGERLVVSHPKLSR